MENLLQQLQAGQAKFADVLAFIDANYAYQATAFDNGSLHNSQDQNQGSAKVFSLGKLQGLSAAQTLQLFAEHYQAVLATPDGNDHQNIRQFIQHGWAGIQMPELALQAKSA